jgi:hypothetical protein
MITISPVERVARTEAEFDSTESDKTKVDEGNNSAFERSLNMGDSSLRSRTYSAIVPFERATSKCCAFVAALDLDQKGSNVPFNV